MIDLSQYRLELLHQDGEFILYRGLCPTNAEVLRTEKKKRYNSQRLSHSLLKMNCCGSAIFEKMANWQRFSITDGRLITGQNPASSTSAAQALVKLMTQQTARATGDS